MIIQSEHVQTGDITINSELSNTVSDFSKEAESILANFDEERTDIIDLKEMIAAFCENAKQESPKRSVCRTLLGGLKTGLHTLITNSEALVKLFSLGEKIMGFLS